MPRTSSSRQDLVPHPMLGNETLYVGVDVGKKAHVAGFISSILLQRHQRFEHCPALAFENSREGFRSLIDRIRMFVPLTQVQALLEVTGHYHRALLQYLQELDIPTGCATSFTSTAIRFESILHRFSFSRKRRCLNPRPWTSASVERACQGASIENTAALCILWARLIQADESLARTAGQVEAFCHMLRQRQGYRLRGWLEEVEQHGEPELQAFARNLHKEESAVQAGLTLAWSNGPTEGFLHRLTLLKRQAYGRAGVALLKQRMLFHPSDLLAA